MTALCNWLTGNSSGLLITLLLCLALGYAIGQVKLGPISLGSTVGTLLMAVVVSAVVGTVSAYTVPDALRYLFFYLFIFALGYQVGPVFVKSLRTSGLKLIGMSVIFTVVALLVGIACKLVFGLGSGELVGLYAGTATQSSVLGAAQAMMPGLGITGAAAEAMESQMTAAYALGYLISYAGCVIFIKCVMPYVVGCKGVPGLRDAVKKELDATAPKGDGGKTAVFHSIRLRTYRLLPGSALVGKPLSALESQFDGRVMVEMLLRDTAPDLTVDFTADTVLQAGDVVALAGELEAITELSVQDAQDLAEVADAKYQKISLSKQRVVVTKALTPAEHDLLFANHVMVTDIARGGKPVDAGSGLQHGDVVTLMGTSQYLQRVVKQIGYQVDNSDDTNVTYMSFGMIAGLLVGLLSITIAGVPIGLGTSGGLILLGIFCGWYNDKKPGRGYISPGALWWMKSVGLNLFVACLGLNSGATFVSSVKEMGIPMIISIILMSILPHVLTALICKPLLHLSPVELLGGVCGSGTNTAALNALTDETGSSIFAASYTPAYAMANIALTFLGVISIALFH